MRTILHTITILAGCTLLSGCRQQAREREYHTGSGIASAIDVETGIVSMEWTKRRTGAKETLSGRITRETEIFINGISASVEDVRAGDHVEVTAYWLEEKREWTVTRVAVEREESFMLSRPSSLTPTPSAPSPGGR